ncbi:MAG: pirin family protein [Cyanobacteriota bacterium]|jgi:redox-sensitive bicupin YhaK (pirin superfamily)
MLLHRKSQERGYADHGWLQSYHTFSFAHYYDPDYLNFRSLRVINEDRIRGGGGFATHSHRDMEIITYVLSGRLEHQDSLGNQALIEPGKIQRMSAGTGITHSEYNASETEPVHLLQIWLLPNQTRLPPSYEETFIDLEASRGQFQTIATPTGEQDTITIHQNATLSVARLAPGERLPLPVADYAWLQVSKGSVSLGEISLGQGDGLGISEEENLPFLQGESESEVLWFNLA